MIKGGEGDGSPAVCRETVREVVKREATLRMVSISSAYRQHEIKNFSPSGTALELCEGE